MIDKNWPLFSTRKFGFVLFFCHTILSHVKENTKAKNKTCSSDGHSPIHVKEGHVQGIPKGSTIQAVINGHMLIVMFSENLGQVSIEVATATGTPVECLSTQTPTGVNLYVPHAGDYIITFTLPNGDEYYGEFTVTD